MCVFGDFVVFCFLLIIVLDEISVVFDCLEMVFNEIVGWMKVEGIF